MPRCPVCKQRLLNQFPFFGDDMLMTGGIGEFVAQGLGPTWQEAARLVGQAGWRAEVHSLSTNDFMTEISGYELVNAEFDITDLRWVIAHVPRITLEWVNRLKAIGGGLSLTGWQYLAGNLPATAPQYAGPPFRLIVDSGIPAGMSSDGMQIAPMNPWIHMYYATTGLNARGVQINPGQQVSRQEVLEPLHLAQRLVPPQGGRPRLARARQAGRPGRPEQGLLQRAGPGAEADPLGADRCRRKDRPQRRLDQRLIRRGAGALLREAPAHALGTRWRRSSTAAAGSWSTAARSARSAAAASSR